MNRLKKFLKSPVVQQPLPLRHKIDINLRALHLKPLSWVKFTWDLTKLPATPTELPLHYHIERAKAEDAFELRKVLSSAFMLDPVWSPAIGQVMQIVQSWLDKAFEQSNQVCLALRHGSRIVGASVLICDSSRDNHLMPGPSISMEYRNREFGTLMLEHSLRQLREAGLTHASGIARDISTAAKFLYPKFEGVLSPCEANILAAA